MSARCLFGSYSYLIATVQSYFEVLHSLFLIINKIMIQNKNMQIIRNVDNSIGEYIFSLIELFLFLDFKGLSFDQIFKSGSLSFGTD